MEYRKTRLPHVNTLLSRSLLLPQPSANSAGAPTPDRLVHQQLQVLSAVEQHINEESTQQPPPVLFSDLRRNVEAGEHSLTSFAREVQHICEGAIVRLFPVDKAAASKVLGALDIANRMLLDWEVAHDAPQRPQYAPVNDRGLWLPPAEVQQYLQPAPPPWEPPPPPLPAWLQDVAPEQLQAAALQLAAHQQQQQFEQQQQQLAQQQYIQQQEQQYAAQFAPQPLPLPPPPQMMSMQEFLQLPHQEQHYQLLLQRRQQAAAAANWDAVLAAQSPADNQMRRVVRHTVRRPPSAPNSGKRKDSSDGSGASKLANGSARGAGVAKPPKKPKVDSEEQPALSQAQRNFLAELLDGLAADPKEEEEESADKLAQVIRQHAARVRDSNAAESSTAMGISMQSVAQGLRLGQFDCLADVDIAIEAACSTGLHAFLDQNLEGVRRSKMVALAEQYLKAVQGASETLLQTLTPGSVLRPSSAVAAPRRPHPATAAAAARREAAAAAATAAAEAGTIPQSGVLPASILANREPFRHGEWRRQPYVPRPYVRLETYDITEDRETLEAKLLTTKRGGCDGSHCQEEGQLGSYSFEVEGFDTQCECLQRNTECDAHCACSSARCLNRAVGQQRPLQLGSDVDEIDSWGFDCYTRRNFCDAVIESGALDSFSSTSSHSQQQSVAAPTAAASTSAATAQPSAAMFNGQQPQVPPPIAAAAAAVSSPAAELAPYPEQGQPGDAEQLMGMQHSVAQLASRLCLESAEAAQPMGTQPEAAAAAVEVTQPSPAAEPPDPASEGASQPGPAEQEQGAAAAAVEPAAAAGVGDLPEAAAAEHAAAEQAVAALEAEVPVVDSAALDAAQPPEALGQQLASRHQAAVAHQAEELHEGHAAPPHADELQQRASEWVDKVLSPAINAQRIHGWDVLRALKRIQAQAAPGSLDAKAAAAIEKRLRKAGHSYFRIHPKGNGIVVRRPGGLAPITFVSEYLGELHTPARWFEIQDVIKKGGNDELPDFYNIVLERPRDDGGGFDVLFIDAASKGAFASRMSHSCTPNCQAVVMACDGRLTIALYTLRHVAEGEELTFDYSSVTESEKEFREAICLCGTQNCRGSFLMFSGSRAFMQVMVTHHNFLMRQALLLLACTQECQADDRERLEKHGIKDSALGSLAAGNRVPPWLEKWAALTLQFVEEEQALLPPQLCAIPPPQAFYTPSSAAIEARGVAENRLQNIVITLDKVKRYLRQPGQPHGPPLLQLSDAEIVRHLWSGERSVMKRLLRGAAGVLTDAMLVRGLGNAVSPEELSRLLERYASSGGGHLSGLAQACMRPVETAEDARTGLLELAAQLRQVDIAVGGGHTAAADLATLYGHTQHWFTAERNYKGFLSEPVRLNTADLNLDRSGSVAGNSGGDDGVVVVQPNGAPLKAPAKRPAPAKKPLAKKPGRSSGGGRRGGREQLCKKYGQGFVWGQLNGWFKQTVYDPTASLSAERRGTLSLPDADSAYSGSHGRYHKKERDDLLQHLEKRPDAMWRTGSIWSFRNDDKIYGSPMFDRAVWRAKGEGANPLPALLATLRAAPLPFGRRTAAAAVLLPVDGGASAGGAAALTNGTAAHGNSGGSSQEDELAKRREQEASDAALARQLQDMDAESP